MNFVMLRQQGEPARAPGKVVTHALKAPAPAWTETEFTSRSGLDRLTHAYMGRFTSSISPAGLALAYLDWTLHLMLAPGKRQELVEKAWRKMARLHLYSMRAMSGMASEPCIEPLPHDRRFRDRSWQHWPFNVVYQSFLLQQQWWHNATTGVGGVSKHHEELVAFTTRQILDMMSPVNCFFTNPEVLDATFAESGQNLLRGAMSFAEDCERMAGGKPQAGTEAYQPGRTLAVTPGRVVYRNRLIELIQYEPQTPDVHAEPVLIVPAWIMKYYILDLSPHNSLVNYLVGRGHTVFMISWHNPDARDRDLGMEEYLGLGILEALDAVQAIVPDRKVNAVGYCLGGTLLAIAAAFLAQKPEQRLNSLTLFAAQTDFTEAGELRLFIDESQLNYLEDIMWDQGYMDNRQMAGAFQLLRSHDLIWSRIVNQYLLGRKAPMNDLMAWNADATRMPYRMQSEYLRRLFLDNELFAGRYAVHGRPVALSDITVPFFVVGTEADHVAPWRSVYKINMIATLDVSFLLTNGGHNAGIVSEPGHGDRHYRLSRRERDSRYVDPESWYLQTPVEEGSWWPVWGQWLEEKSSGLAEPPAMGAREKGYAPLDPAPGRYVMER